MSYKNLLTDKCDVFKQKKKTETYGYGIEGDKSNYYYDSIPDHEDVPCYFYQVDSSVYKSDPNTKIIETYKVHFLIDAPIELKDKIKKDGVLFELRKPNKIRNHHIEVIAFREGSL